MMDEIAARGHGAPPDFLTVEEAARVLRLGRTATYRLVRAGVIPSVRYGKQFRIPRIALEQALGGPITWPPPTIEPDNTPSIASVTCPAARRRTTRRRPSGGDQSSFPFSA
jgi:excisionase family DNA binding protein